MPFSTPKFWYKKRGFKSYALLPIAWVYQCAHKFVQSQKPTAHHSTIPVICIGNAVAGGGGKTPTVIALIKLITAHKIAKNPFIISRGYGGNNLDSKRVNLEKHTAQDVGDEPIILAQHAPVIIGKDRKKSADMAIDNGADLIIMDDGFFNTSLHQNIKILVVDRNMDFGNGFTIPAGPLREPLKNILPKSNAIITIGPKFQSDLPVFETELCPANHAPPNGDYVGFCAIGFPEKFKATLHKSDYNLVGWHEYPDHHHYTDQDIKKLLDEAKSKNARLITTEKDFVKIPAQYKEMVDILYITLEFKSPSDIATYLKKELVK